VLGHKREHILGNNDVRCLGANGTFRISVNFEFIVKTRLVGKDSPGASAVPRDCVHCPRHGGVSEGRGQSTLWGEAPLTGKAPWRGPPDVELRCTEYSL
jgi:hypothetical protein